MLPYGNTLFRNENSGAYFLRESVNTGVIGTIAYENVKGLRWGSGSRGGLVVDNTLFDNHERGLAIEATDRMLVRRNRLANNGQSQLLVLEGGYGSADNCFENGGPQQPNRRVLPVLLQPRALQDAGRVSEGQAAGSRLARGRLWAAAAEDRRPEAPRGDHGLGGTGPEGVECVSGRPALRGLG